MTTNSPTPVVKIVDREAQRAGYKKTSRWKLFQQTLEKEMKARKLNGQS
jgi:hypothetical protein